MSNKHPKYFRDYNVWHPTGFIDNQLEALNEFDSLYDMSTLDEMFDRLFPHNNREGKEHAQ